MRGNGCNIPVVTHGLVQPDIMKLVNQGDCNLNVQFFLLCLKRDELLQILTTEINIYYIAEHDVGTNLMNIVKSSVIR